MKNVLVSLRGRREHLRLFVVESGQLCKEIVEKESCMTVGDIVIRKYAEQAPVGSKVVGNIVVIEAFASPELGNQRDILVYLPPSYVRGARRYPVIYMHDGQNLFDEATSFAHEWGVDETLEAASQDGLEAIVVGIPNMRTERLDEYSPFADKELGGGHGLAYLRFIIETLKPAIDRTFRTLPEREQTVLMGSSMGGLISLYGFLHHGETFGAAGVMSPALWFADRAIFADIAHTGHVPGRLYLDVGTAEGEETLANTRRLCMWLEEMGYQPGVDLFYVEEAGAKHAETAWRARLLPALRFLLDGRVEHVQTASVVVTAASDV